MLRPNIIENDFKKLLSKSEKYNIPFIAIFIDEADLFSKNKGLNWSKKTINDKNMLSQS